MKIATSFRLGFFALAALALLAGCSDDKTEPSSTEAPAPEAAPSDAPPADAAAEADANVVPSKIDISAVRDDARTAMFIPAPSEFQAALKSSNVAVDIRKQVKDSDRTLQGKNRSIIALETGVRLANLLLSVQTADKAVLIARMKRAREGLVALGSPDDLVKEVDRVVVDFEKDVLSAAELGPALDVLAEQIQDDLAEQADPAVGTLVQAGGWVQGVNLLSTALADGGMSGDAAALLHQPTVLAYFTAFLKQSDAGRSGDPDVVAVISEMEKMALIAGKDSLSTDDVKSVAAHTAAILAWF